MQSPADRPSELGLTRQKAIAGFRLKEFSQPPHRHLPWHDHHDASICFVVSGSYRERIGSREWECTPHTMVFKPPFERHADRFDRLGGQCLLIEISPSRLAALEPLPELVTQPSHRQSARLAGLGQRIYRELVGGDAYSPLAVEGLVLEVLVEGSRARGEGVSETWPSWLRRTRDLIHATPNQALTLSAVAGAVGIHPSHLARVFRKHFRCSIGEYVRQVRIERAACDLTDSRETIAAVALRWGFFDQSHFARVFKRQIGQTPVEFRARCRSRTAGPNSHLMS